MHSKNGAEDTIKETGRFCGGSFSSFLSVLEKIVLLLCMSTFDGLLV